MSELPKGWVETELGNVTNYGATTKPDLKNIDDECWVLELEDIEKDSSKLLKRLSFADRAPKSSKNSFVKGDVLYGKLRPYLNKVLIATEDGICTTEIVPLKIPNDLFDNRFLFYWLKGKQFSDYVNAVSYGVNMPRLGTKDGKKAPMIVAPLAEQKRIVEKLDEVLAQVDTIKARLDGIPGLLKRFRQSVLASAVSGKLTEEWRGNYQPSEPVLKTYEEFKNREINKATSSAQRNKINKTHEQGESSEFSLLIPDTWILKNLNKLAFGFSYGSSAKSQPSGEIPVLRMGNIQRGKLDWDGLVYTSDLAEIDKYRLVKGDVLFNRTNSPELVGKTTIYRGEREAIYAGYLIKVQGSEVINSEFINIVLNSTYAKNYCMSVKTDGVSQSNINAQKLGAFPCPLPPLEEQKEIVRLVDQYFAFADNIEAQVKKAQARVDNLTPSILAKAFRGELVDQDPNDEPADKLLERISEARKEAEALAKAAKKAEAAKKRAAKSA